MIKKVYQQNLTDCGVACLLSIIKYYGGDNTFENIRYLTKCDNNGITALNLVEASKKLGFNARGLRIKYEDLKDYVKPLICHLVLKNGYHHYIVLYKVDDKFVLIFDPYYGIKKYTKEYFTSIWDNIIFELIPYRKLDVIKEEKNKLYNELIIKNKYKYLSIIIYSILSIILTIITNMYFKYLIDGYNTISILIYFILVILIKEIIDLFRNKKEALLRNDILKELMINTHEKMLSLPNYYFNSRTSGDIITKFNDLEYVEELLLKFPISLIIDTILIIITITILFNISSKLTIIFLVLTLLYFSIILLFDKKIKNGIMVNQENNSIKNKVLVENIKCIETIKNNNIQRYRNNIFIDVYNNYLKNKNKYEKLYININFVKNIILYIGLNIILFEGIKLVNNNTLLLSDLILFDSLMIYFIEPLKDICNLSPIFKNGINSIKRVNEIYFCKDKTGNKNVDNYDIRFNNLTFSYDGYKNIINNFNYNINHKDKILVIGKSGSGKSTLFKLLNKSYRVDNNMIYISNTDINDILIDKYITYVSQDEKLFNDTIYNNIVLDGNDNKLNEIIEITGLNNVLKNRNLSIHNIIEEDGSNLSKGEKQRIIISRALLKNRNIIIFDESLNALEDYDEVNIMSNILNKFSDKTIIYISHSKECINMFKKILNFDN